MKVFSAAHSWNRLSGSARFGLVLAPCAIFIVIIKTWLSAWSQFFSHHWSCCSWWCPSSTPPTPASRGPRSQTAARRRDRSECHLERGSLDQLFGSLSFPKCAPRNPCRSTEPTFGVRDRLLDLLHLGVGVEARHAVRHLNVVLARPEMSDFVVGSSASGDVSENHGIHYQKPRKTPDIRIILVLRRRRGSGFW